MYLHAMFANSFGEQYVVYNYSPYSVQTFNSREKAMKVAHQNAEDTEVQVVDVNRRESIFKSNYGEYLEEYLEKNRFLEMRNEQKDNQVKMQADLIKEESRFFKTQYILLQPCQNDVDVKTQSESN